MPTNLYTDVLIGDTTYTIRKFDAKTGLKLARLIVAKATKLINLFDDDKPSGKGKKKAAAENADIYQTVGTVLESLSDEDLDTIIDKCLRACFVKLPAGLQPVLDENGNYGVEGIEYDMPLTLKLCFEAIKWGASDFFGDNGLDLSRLMKSTGLSQNQ